MTKKTKILIAIILLLVTAITTSLVVLSTTTISHCMQINAPNRIAVYYNSESNNKVYDSDTEQYNVMYNAILDGFKQTTLSSLLNKQLFKDVKIKSVSSTEIDFSGIKIVFMYNNPQTVKYKKKLYSHNDKNYWYQSLIFNITDYNGFKHNTIAIIPPSEDKSFVSYFNYNLYYQAFSNFKNVYNIALDLFS